VPVKYTFLGFLGNPEVTNELETGLTREYLATPSTKRRYDLQAETLDSKIKNF
jgi:hypothetical protein